uniref:Tyrosine-protein phosphatase non-receptor type n=1 Tax=Pavo cristatus TaxID=9049 RepID=A0A8C9G226_PAVCR
MIFFQITYFSLWYYNKQNQRRWVDLDKPLKKQLDKYALEPTVYFGVVFYVPTVSQLQQEITRYQYYLQLKKDILEGNIPCTLEQAIHLAGLAVQADFGDYDQYESQEFLQRFALFPVLITVITVFFCRGLTPPDAEMLYMQEVERMEGYGEETYPAKDSQGSDIFIGACLDGIFVKHKNSRPPVVFRWHDIANMSHNKSFFALELANKEETIQFQTEDMETAKYVWRMCVARHKFYRLNKCSLQTQPITVNPVRRRSSSRMSMPKPQAYMMPPPPQLHYNGHYTEPYASSQELNMRQVSKATVTNVLAANRSASYGSRYIVGAVSVPELTNVQLQAQDYPAPNIMKTQVYRPPPPYPYPRPANSTPDLSRHVYISSSNPDLITRRVHHSVQTFQEDSLPVAHSLQEVSEPLTSARHAQLQKRNSIEIAGLTPSFEGIRIKERTMSASAADVALPRVISEGSQPNILIERAKQKENEQDEGVNCDHKKTLSDATMLIHSSEEEEEFEENKASTSLSPLPEDQTQLSSIMGGYSHDSVLNYPYSSVASSTGPLHILEPKLHITETEKRMKDISPVHLLVENQVQRRGEGLLTPSMSESDLTTSGRYRVRKDSVKKRPVSDLLSGKKNIVEGLPPLGGMKKNKTDAKKIGPLKLAALNGLTLARMPLPDEGKEESTRATNDERCKVLEQRLEQGMVFTEYERIQKKRLIDGECSIARLPENAERNRFQDVLPYDDTRVELVPTKENNTGYINASHIKISVGGIEWDYIATQGPLQNTCQDFWQMIWEQGIAIIAMVTAEEESGREKSFRYWPRLGSRHNTVTYGRFKITTRFRTDSGCYATTGLKIKHLLTGQERTVWHLQYTDWPEHGCPEDIKGFLSYLEEIQSVRRHTNSTADPKNSNPPVLVHCSAGVGRTGVVILSEIMIACLEHNEMLDIPRVLDMLRHQRMMMVQTLSQYTFVYGVLIQFLKSSRLI